MMGTEETRLAPTLTTLLLQVRGAGLCYSTFLFSTNHETLFVQTLFVSSGGSYCPLVTSGGG